MCLIAVTSTSKTINSRIMVRSRAPIRYTIQAGGVGNWVGVGAGGGGGGNDSAGAGGVTSVDTGGVDGTAAED